MKRPAGGDIAFLTFALAACGAVCSTAAAEDRAPRSAEARAVAFLAAEVPRWAKENACYSCHNNGDAARALLAALKSGDLVLRAPLDDTLAFYLGPSSGTKTVRKVHSRTKNWPAFSLPRRSSTQFSCA